MNYSASWLLQDSLNNLWNSLFNQELHECYSIFSFAMRSTSGRGFMLRSLIYIQLFKKKTAVNEASS